MCGKKKEETAVAVMPSEPDGAALQSLGNTMTLPSVAEQEIALTEYDERRDFFRAWLLGHLKQGVHFGFPPGCEAKLDSEGNMLQWSRKQNKYVAVPKAQWRVRPSLYKAGALFLVDLLKLRAEYDSDLDGWKMLGEPKGTFVRSCILHSSEGRVLGKGTGAFKVGEKGMNENASIKMADKRALVAAVINSLAVCADLFTQDMEEGGAPAMPEAPKMDAAAVKAFGSMVQEWLEESIDPNSPIGDHKVTSKEVEGLHALMKVWIDPAPETLGAARDWLKANAEILANENSAGEVVGVRFARKAEATE